MSSGPDERRGPGTTKFTIHFLDKSAPGTIGAAVILSLMGAAFAVVGVGGTTISAAVSGAFARSTVWTNSLVPLAVLDRRSAALALGIGAVAAVVVGGLLVLSAVRLGQGHRSGQLVLTVTCCAFVVLNYSVGLMIGNLPVVFCVVATGCAWMPTSRRFLRDRGPETVPAADAGQAHDCGDGGQGAGGRRRRGN